MIRLHILKKLKSIAFDILIVLQSQLFLATENIYFFSQISTILFVYAKYIMNISCFSRDFALILSSSAKIGCLSNSVLQVQLWLELIFLKYL